MKNITKLFTQSFTPRQALLIYTAESDQALNSYVEVFDIDGDSGKPINAHPLSMPEAEALAKALHQPGVKSRKVNKGKQTAFLQPVGLLPTNVLFVHWQGNSSVIWHTPAGERGLYFVDSLSIPSGKAQVPAMVWKATRTSLTVFALFSNARPKADTHLYMAPFFNVNGHGQVCMGTVQRDITDSSSLEAFIEAWEGYFFNSYFSHTLGNQSPAKVNIVQLWQQAVATNAPFPTNVLIKTRLTLQSLISNEPNALRP